MALKVGELYADAKMNTGGFTSGISTLTSSVLRFKKTALLAFGAVGAAVGGALVSSTKKYSDYEDELVNAVTKTTDARKESEEFAQVQDKLDNKFKSLGETTRYTMQDIAVAGRELGKTGYNVEETIAALSGVVDVASASGEALPIVAKRLTNVAKGFGLDASELGRLGDIFAEAARSSNTSIVELSEAMKYFAPIADAMGWSEEKATALIGTLGDWGIASGQAGRQFKSVLVDWQKLQSGMANKKDMEVMQEIVEGLGMNFKDFNKKVQSGQTTFMDFLRMLGKSDQTVAAVSQLFTKLSAAPLTKLAEEGGGAWADLTDKLANSEGVASDVARAQEDTLAGATDILRGSLSKLQVAIGEKLSDPLKTFMQDVLIKLVNKFSDWVEHTDSISEAFKDMGEYVPGLNETFTVMKELITWMVNNKKAAVTAIEGIAGAWAAFKVAQMVSLATPLGQIATALTAIATAGALIAENRDAIAKFFKGMWEDKLKPVAGKMKDFFAGLGETLVDALGLGGLIDHIKNIIDMISNLIDKIKKFIDKPFGGLFGGGNEGGGNEGGGVSQGVKDAFSQKIVPALSQMLQQFWEMPATQLSRQLQHLPQQLLDISKQQGKFPIPFGKVTGMERANLLKTLVPALEGKISPKTSTETNVDITVGENVTVQERRSIEELNRAVQKAYESWERRQGNK